MHTCSFTRSFPSQPNAFKRCEMRHSHAHGFDRNSAADDAVNALLPRVGRRVFSPSVWISLDGAGAVLFGEARPECLVEVVLEYFPFSFSFGSTLKN